MSFKFRVSGFGFLVAMVFGVPVVGSWLAIVEICLMSMTVFAGASCSPPCL